MTYHQIHLFFLLLLAKLIPIQLMLILDGTVVSFRIFLWFKRRCIFLQFPQVLSPFSFSFFLEVLYLL